MKTNEFINIYLLINIIQEVRNQISVVQSIEVGSRIQYCGHSPSEVGYNQS